MSTKLPTPIPVGSPHVTHPPQFDRWGLGPGRVGRKDLRDYARRKLACEVWIVDPTSQSVLRCKTNNISDAGLHATAPIGYGLAVAQRFEVRITGEATARTVSAHLAKSLGYATVIRTEILVSNDKPDRVGFAVRFDVPQLIPV